MTKSMYEEVSERIETLRRRDKKWVKHSPNVDERCAIVEGVTSEQLQQRRLYPLTVKPIRNDTIRAIDRWMADNTDWSSLVGYNDDANGAQSVDDVIVIFEKFRAEL